MNFIQYNAQNLIHFANIFRSNTPTPPFHIDLESSITQGTFPYKILTAPKDSMEIGNENANES